MHSLNSLSILTCHVVRVQRRKMLPLLRLVGLSNLPCLKLFFKISHRMCQIVYPADQGLCSICTSQRISVLFNLKNSKWCFLNCEDMRNFPYVYEVVAVFIVLNMYCIDDVFLPSVNCELCMYNGFGSCLLK